MQRVTFASIQEVGMGGRVAGVSPPPCRAATHLESICFEVDSIEGNAVAGLLNGSEVEEGVLGLGTSRCRAPVIQGARGDR